MSVLYGYGGNVLDIDLSTRRVSKSQLDRDFARQYIGGRGFVARLLWDLIPKGADPLGPDNVAVVASGPLTGAFLPSSSKVEFGAKSPATGGYGDSNMGGHFGPALKHAGYDVCIIRGASSTPVYVVIDDDIVQIRDASHLWGKGSYATEKALKEELGDDFQIAVIGPAGENLVKIACITHDFGRQAGRCGIGAVWGSKRLKAIAVRGSRGFPVADPAAMFKKGKEMFDIIFKLPGFKEWTPYGTAEITDWCNKSGVFPTRNFYTGYFPHYQQINGRALRNSIVTLDKGCFGCPIPCGKYSHVNLPQGLARVEGPEYETVALFGGNCELSRIEEIAFANWLFDDLGMDTISGGNIVAFAIECFEKGIISEDDLGGKPVRFGDLDSVIHIGKLIANRHLVGDLLAEGVKTASAHLGRGSEHFAIHVKGLEVSGYEPRYAAAMLLAYMTCDVGAHHNRAWAITYDIAVGRDKLEGKAAKVVELQHLRPLLDALGICRFPWIEVGFELRHYAEIFPMITGSEQTWEELNTLSERIWNLTRAFWVREVPGFGRSWDRAPGRFLADPVPSGAAQGKLLGEDIAEQLLDEYYRLRGWDEQGIPKREKLLELGLSDVACALYE